MLKPPIKFFADFVHQGDVHLVVEKTVHLQHIAFLNDTVLCNPSLQEIHKHTLSFCIFYHYNKRSYTLQHPKSVFGILHKRGKKEAA